MSVAFIGVLWHPLCVNLASDNKSVTRLDSKWEDQIISELKGYKDYKWIVKDPEYMGGKLALRGTRLSVSHILGCLAEGMDHKEIEASYGPVSKDAILEVLAVAAEVTENPDVAA